MQPQREEFGKKEWPSPLRRESDVYVRNAIGLKQSSSFAPLAITVGTTATKILAANSNRIAFEIQNINASEQIWIGGQEVAINNGFQLTAMHGLPYVNKLTKGDVYAVTSSGEFVVMVYEYTS